MLTIIFLLLSVFSVAPSSWAEQDAATSVSQTLIELDALKGDLKEAKKTLDELTALQGKMEEEVVTVRYRIRRGAAKGTE